MSEASIQLVARGVVSLPPGTTLTVGRGDGADVLGLDSTDRGISARQAEFEWRGDVLVLRNCSSKRPLSVEYEGEVRHQRVPPGAGHTFRASALVLVGGIARTHPVGVQVPPGYAHGLPLHGEDTVVGEIAVSDRDRDALVALFAGYLRRWPRHHPEPLSYEEAASLLGPDVTSDTVRKRVERVRERINASGSAFIDGRNALWDLVAFLIDNGTLHPSNLERIGEQVNWKGPAAGPPTA